MLSSGFRSRAARTMLSAVAALLTNAMSSDVAPISFAIEARRRSASSYQLRKSVQASSSRCCQCFATASVARRGSWPKVAVFKYARFSRAGNSLRIFCQSGFDKGRRLRHGDIGRHFRAAVDHFHETLRHLLADVDAIGNPDQVRVLEFHARTLIAIVQQHVEP